jgi:GMP synthase-like glutamine amidotransferase
MNLSAYWKPSLLLLAFATVGTVSWTAAMSVDKAAIAEWHGDTFDLPEGAVLLASSKEYPHQAFRFGSCAYGLQFHVEPDSETWSVGESNCRANWLGMTTQGEVGSNKLAEG